MKESSPKHHNFLSITVPRETALSLDEKLKARPDFKRLVKIPFVDKDSEVPDPYHWYTDGNQYQVLIVIDEGQPDSEIEFSRALQPLLDEMLES